MSIIKTKEQIEGCREAASVVRNILYHKAINGINLASNTKEIENWIHGYAKTTAYDIEFPCLNYKLKEDQPPYPSICCISVNDVLCHGIPNENTKIEIGDIVKVDLALKVNGYYADACRCLVKGATRNTRAYNLCETSKLVTYAGIRALRPGKRLGDIGWIMNQVAEACGYHIVKEFCGHGVGISLHEMPTVYAFGERNRGEELQPGMILAIEPIIVEGKTDYIIDQDGWTVRTKDKGWAGQWEETILVTDTGYEILT